MERDLFPAGNRRDQDVALDLLKFVASTAGVAKPTAPSTGFTAATAAKPEDQVAALLDLYGRCLRAVQEGNGAATGKAGSQ